MPDPDEDLDEFGKVWRFALTFDGYRWAGGTTGLALVADAVRRRWESGELDVDTGLPLLRAALFCEQRGWRMAVQDLRNGAMGVDGMDAYGTMPWMQEYPNDARYVRALLQAIRAAANSPTP